MVVIAVVPAAAAPVAGVAVNTLFVEGFGIEVDGLAGLEVAAVPSSCCTLPLDRERKERGCRGKRWLSDKGHLTWPRGDSNFQGWMKRRCSLADYVIQLERLTTLGYLATS